MAQLEKQIARLEQVVAQPYIKEKERPYHLHSILIHDGLAENGHYYSYVYDRVNRAWWQYNDHKATKVDAEQVMKEALGDATAYKSACNLVYISKHVADQIDQLKVAQYTRSYANNLVIPK